ncbi:DUF5081 family protein [Rummeliibacillus sp. TYF005]|jgi:hypothetical protein|uniref:DUF5081 family protein n=1 Tax=unclassified Rummeliibacillus TaxID=2622809 RepID=UPI000E664F1B|nr:MULTISPECIES: DUF5081 family protein [unclassified Rummeliibacillus]RIJ63133.1 DUF5081 family protein [Rummeliibacillus sp. POC4]RPJ94151.1 DUF5081 family protein [Rummeliibacillus sp. TYF005]
MTALYTAEELLLLASAFKCQMLFGLPDRQLLVMRHPQGFDEAKQSLIDKEIMTVDGNLTTNGGMVIQLLEQYAISNRYIRLDNLMTGFGTNNHLITIKWREDGKFQLYVHQDIAFLKRIMEGYPLFNREPLPEDTTYLKKIIRQNDVEEYFEQEKSTVQLECFKIDYEKKTTSIEQWIFFENNGKLQGIDVNQENTYQLSQYFLVKKIYDFYRFPYKEADLR